MNGKMVRYILGRMLGVEALLLLLPAFVGILYGEEKEALTFVIPAVILTCIFVIAGRKRPERQVIADQYAEEIPEFVLRTKVKAGLTGYAQVYGKYNTTPYDKLKFDITYIENYSLWLDVKIMLLTFKILFQKENTEGVDETQQTALKD